MPDKRIKRPGRSAKAVAPDPVVSNTTKSEPVTDRTIRSGYSHKNAACPVCKAFPTITKIRRPGYELRRCRECGHRFELKGGD